jgi:hypothetical protein
MKKIGFSTGAIALGDFDKALLMLSASTLDAIELSALRISEVRPLIEAIPRLNLTSYSYISFHAPSSYPEEEEEELVNLLAGLPKSWPIIVHPDAMFNAQLWQRFGCQLAIENMDRRKPIGRTAVELAKVFDILPSASMCFDIGHARQFDASMSEAYLIIMEFYKRIVQVHVSEVDTSNRHFRISFAAEIAFRQISNLLPASAPLILESRVSEGEITSEVERAQAIFA